MLCCAGQPCCLRCCLGYTGPDSLNSFAQSRCRPQNQEQLRSRCHEQGPGDSHHDDDSSDGMRPEPPMFSPDAYPAPDAVRQLQRTVRKRQFRHAHTAATRPTMRDGGPCSSCEKGTYKPLTGSHACTHCEPGNFLAASAAVSNSTCMPCERGLGFRLT